MGLNHSQVNLIERLESLIFQGFQPFSILTLIGVELKD